MIQLMVDALAVDVPERIAVTIAVDADAADVVAE